jgi:hypothetical protein
VRGTADLHTLSVLNGILTGIEICLHCVSVLGKPEEFPFYFVQVLIERNPAFKQIEHLEKGSVETGKKVKEALSGNEPLFTFKDKKIVKIGEA